MRNPKNVKTKDRPPIPSKYPKPIMYRPSYYEESAIVKHAERFSDGFRKASIVKDIIKKVVSGELVCRDSGQNYFA